MPNDGAVGEAGVHQRDDAKRSTGMHNPFLFKSAGNGSSRCRRHDSRRLRLLAPRFSTAPGGRGGLS